MVGPDPPTKEIPDDVKVFLRSILSTSAGIHQEKVCKEYKDMTGDILPFKELGYKNLYSFLLALEGEVTRLEFDEKCGDNIVYVVLDETKFASGHAKKNSKKERTGIKHKSPEEIKAWCQNRGNFLNRNAGSKPKNSKRNGNGRSAAGSSGERNTKKVQPSSKPFLSEGWSLLNKLNANPRNKFVLSVTADKDCQRNNPKNTGPLSKEFILKVFSQYGCIGESINPLHTGHVFVPFPTYYRAFVAWMETNERVVDGHKIHVEPSVERELKWLHNSHKVYVKEVPYGRITLFDFVDLWAPFFNDLLKIETHTRIGSATLYFREKSSFDKVIAGCYSVKVDARTHSLQVAPVEMERLPNTSNNGILKPPDLMSLNIGGLLPTLSPTIHPTTPLSATIHPPSSSSNTTRFPAFHSTEGIVSEQKPEQLPVPDEKPPECIPKDRFSDQHCGFCVNFEEAEKMFQVTCKRSPRTCRNVADSVEFVATYPVDGCRFWMMLVHTEKNPNLGKEFLEMQHSLAQTSEKIMPPNTLPREHMRGSALYKDNKWYRCYVLSRNEEEKTLTVLFVDYGNVEVVSIMEFRLTYSEVWKLPPLAIPCKLYGLEMKPDCTDVQIAEAKDALYERLSERMFKAKVVKESNYSQPHVIELKDIESTSSMFSITLHDILADGYLQVIEGVNFPELEMSFTEGQTTKGNSELRNLPVPANHSTTVTSSASSHHNDEENKEESLFRVEDECIFGMVAEVHNAKLLYLHLGSSQELQALDMALSSLKDLKRPEHLIRKGDILLYFDPKHQDVRRRVMVLLWNNEKTKVKVLHVDYGCIEFVYPQCLFQLHKQLATIQLQARPTELAGVQCDCKEADEFLKTYRNKPVRTNIIKERKSGKIVAELFDIRTHQSINLELLSRGLAHPVSMGVMDDGDDGVSASGISIPGSVDDHNDKTRKISDTSISSWRSLGNASSASIQSTEKETRSTYPNTNSVNTKKWVETTNTEQFKDGPFEGHGRRPETPPFPPPDIISSSIRRSNVMSPGVRLEGNQVFLGKDEQSIDVLNLDDNNCLIPSEVDALREKWRRENEELEKKKKHLELLMRCSPEQLKEKYKEKKKQKLQLLIKMKQLEGDLSKVNDELNTIEDEMESLLTSF